MTKYLAINVVTIQIFSFNYCINTCEYIYNCTNKIGDPSAMFQMVVSSNLGGSPLLYTSVFQSWHSITFLKQNLEVKNCISGKYPWTEK